ncbi:MAG: hypothetical protein M0T85_05830 [Dehalococcoidales bacterium]|nr:hypothetical protein [Dehalococcoidales bacterium]
MAERYPTLAKAIDWAAVVAGFVVSFVIAVLLGLIVSAVGISLGPVTSTIIVFISLLCGGWFAGYMAPANGVLHGLLVAALSIVVSSIVAAAALAGATLLVPGAAVGAVGPGALFIVFIIQLIGGAIGGYIGELTSARPAVRT